MRFEIDWVSFDGKTEVTLLEGMPAQRRIRRIMHKRMGLINGLTASGKGHTVAWDGRRILDPSGTLPPYRYAFAKDYNFNPYEFVWLFPNK